MSVYLEGMCNTPQFDIDLSDCEDCTFECGTIGLCVKRSGENYIISTLLSDKGYLSPNLDSVWLNNKFQIGIQMYTRQCKKFMANMEKLGYKCTLYHHEAYKKYLSTVIIDGEDPVDIAFEFLKLDVVK